MCPVHVLRVYVDRTTFIRRSDQLFVSRLTPRTGKPVSQQRLPHWIVDAICLSYRCNDADPPGEVRAHSNGSTATSWALFRGVSVQDICASWATLHSALL